MFRAIHIFCIILVVAPVTPALAERRIEPAATAQVSPIFPRPRQLAAEGRIWRCHHDICIGRVPRTYSAQQRVCYRLGRVVDRILAFEVEGEPFSTEALARCNGERDAAER